MTTRILPREEWARLAGTEAERAAAFLNPDHGHFLVVEDASGAIVGCLLIVTAVHAECVWIAPAYRKRTSVGRHLWQALRATARRLDLQAVMGAAISEEMRGLMAHVGAVPIPATYYAIPMKGD